TIGVVAVDGIDQSDEGRGFDVVAAEQGTGGDAHPAGERGRQRRVALDERAPRRAVAQTAAGPELAGVHAVPLRPSDPPAWPTGARRTLTAALRALKPHSGLLRIPGRGPRDPDRTRPVLLDEV